MAWVGRYEDDGDAVSVAPLEPYRLLELPPSKQKHQDSILSSVYLSISGKMAHPTAIHTLSEPIAELVRGLRRGQGSRPKE